MEYIPWHILSSGHRRALRTGKFGGAQLSNTSRPDPEAGLSALYELIRRSGEPEAATSIVAMNRILKIAARMRRNTETVAAKFGLRAADIGILLVIDRGEAAGAVRVTDVAQVLHVTPGGISKRLDGLQAAGLVVRQAHADDARAVALALTDRGKAVVGAMRRRPDRQHTLSEEEWRQLDALLAKLADRWPAD